MFHGLSARSGVRAATAGLVLGLGALLLCAPAASANAANRQTGAARPHSHARLVPVTHVAGPVLASKITPPPSRMITPGQRSQATTDRPDPYRRVLVPGGPVPSGTWQPLGPAPLGPPYLAGGGFYGGVNSGRITGIAVITSGTLAGRVVAASAGGGIWTSDNGGTTWTPRSDNAATLAIGSVTVDPSNPNHLIAGTGEGNQSGDSAYGLGILTSTDGGNAWTLSDPGSVFQGLHITQVAIDPSNSNHMFAATDNGLYVTSNGGASWAKPADSSYATVDGHLTSVVVNPTTPTTIYIGGGGAATVAKSTDGGVHWAAANTGIGAPGANPYTALAIADSSPSTLYASVGSSSNPVALYKSTDGGTSWTGLSAPDYTGNGYAYGSGSGEQGWYDDTVAVDPTNPNHVLAGGETVVESTDGGGTWTDVNGQPFFGSGTNLIHPDQHALTFRPDGKVWIGNDGGVYLYTPSGPTVSDANGNLNVTQFYFGYEVGGTVLAGSQDNASAETSSGSLATWTGIWTGDGGPSAITPNDTSVQFIEADSGLYDTTDAFASTLNLITPPTSSLFTPPMTIVPNATTPSQPTVFYGGSDLWRTTDPTDPSPSWTQVTSQGQFVSAIAVSPSNPNVVYVGFDNGAIQVSTDGGSTFSSLATQPFSETFVTGISVDPSNPQAITVSVSYNDTRPFVDFPHVAQYSYSSSPGSGSWSVVTGNLPASGAVSRVVYDNGALVAATDAGVYAAGATAGASTVWSLVGTGLPAVQVQDLFVDPSTNALYAVTHGRGAWALPSSIVAFHITTSSLPSATPGVAYGPVTLQEAGAGTSDSPYVTTIKWKKVTLPKGLKLSKAGVLSGTPNKKLAAGPSSVTVQVTEKVTTLNGKKKVKTETTVQATIPLTIT
jgi:hypothetical protein